jgi:beta-carotene/zeaxanthin 4-ketolase
LRVKHHLHHQYPARDPDFYDGKISHFWAWYAQFVREHISWRQLINLVAIFSIYTQIFQFPIANLCLFWIVPSLLSSLQLFYFGTFLPHCEPIEGYVKPHCAYIICRSRWWLLLTGDRIGYHREHHESPQVSW